MGPGLLLPGPILVSLNVIILITIIAFLLTYAELPGNVETLGSTVPELV
jgi:hypothetical protein